MSIKAMVWAWAQDITTTETLVLLALADRANDEGLCWPGQEGLASKCKLTRETVNRNIKRLEVLGKLRVIHRKDEAQRQITNAYQLCLQGEGGVTQDHTEPCDSDTKSRVTQDHTILLESYEPSVREPSEEGERLAPVDLLEAWNEQCAPSGLTKVAMLSLTRRQKATLRIREHPAVEFWSEVLAQIRSSPFLLGRKNGNGGKHDNWKANFDWLIDNDTNCVKVFEGRYAKE
jgi:Helix-turn-helix domain